MTISPPKWGVESRVANLSEPADYYAGIRGTSVVPRSVLLFKRRSGRQLLGQAKSQHHRYVLITSLGGSGGVGIDAEMRFLKPRESVMVLPFQSHCYVDIRPADICWLFITFEHPEDVALTAIANRGSIPLTLESERHLDNLLKAWEMPDRLGEVSLHLALWLQCLGRQKGKRDVTIAPPGLESRNFVAAVNRFTIANRHRAFDLEELAGHLGISLSLLRTKFRTATGNSVGRHIRELRLNYACRLLHSTGRRIGEIADSCGYDTVFAFSRAFRNAFRCSPTTYRRRAGGGGVNPT